VDACSARVNPNYIDALKLSNVTNALAQGVAKTVKQGKWEPVKNQTAWCFYQKLL
jgi:hypothetical protein